MLERSLLYILVMLFNVIIFSNITTSQASEIKLSFIGDRNSQVFMGVKQGIDEANMQGKFLQQSYSLTIIPSLSTAIFAAVDAKSINQLSKKYPNKAIFNLTIEDDNLRAACFANVLHMLPSKAMKSDAENQWLQKYPQHSVKAQAWHFSFQKYAAGQLNSRFTKAYKNKMTDTAWAGWAAVKLVSDSIARKQLKDTADLLHFIKTDLTFDGQKGIALNFRDTGQLRQPLLLIKDGVIVGEAPVRGIAQNTHLDSLGLAHCPK